MNNQNEIVLDSGNAQGYVTEESKIIDTIHVLKQGKLTYWEETDTILKLGEIAIVIDVPGAYKIGNGLNIFKDLLWRGAVTPIKDESTGQYRLNTDGSYATVLNAEVTLERENLDIKGKIKAQTIEVQPNDEYGYGSIIIGNITLQEGNDGNTDSISVTGVNNSVFVVQNLSGKKLNSEELEITTSAKIKNLIIKSENQEFSFNKDVMDKINQMGANGTIEFKVVSNFSEMTGGYIYLIPQKSGTTLNGYKAYKKGDTAESDSHGTINISTNAPSEEVDNALNGNSAFRKIKLTNDATITPENNGICFSNEIRLVTNEYIGGQGGPGIRLMNGSSSGATTVITQNGVYNGSGYSGYRSWPNIVNPYPIGSVIWTVIKYENSNKVCEQYGGKEWVQLTGFYPYAAGNSSKVYSVEEIRQGIGKARVADGGYNTIESIHLPQHKHDLYGYTFKWGQQGSKPGTSGYPPYVSMQQSGNQMMQSNATKNELVTNENSWNQTAFGGGKSGQVEKFYPEFKHMYCWVRVQ